ncbi:cell division cycle 5-like protein [Tanacetum coccineum]
MRITMKGGIWKNTEDEILKVGVMKYGLNQWSRISSLLVRKDPKQCKARWYQWLDHSIKKIDSTQQEDEKLLHLSKLLPSQWRSIAPLAGRTPSQCLQCYERLLDDAYAKEGTYEAGDDPRKLRHREIDPNPESKPVGPDLAKRKARENQLKEARRLTSLQRMRELKAAGFDHRLSKNQSKGIDYHAEIPFEKRPPLGLYDVTGESPIVYQPKFPTTIEELEGKRRADKEARLRKQDVAKNKIT